MLECCHSKLSFRRCSMRTMTYSYIFIKDQLFVSTKISILAKDLQIPTSIICSVKVVSFDVSSQRRKRYCVFESPSDAWRRSDATIRSIKHCVNHSKFVRASQQKQSEVQQEKLQRSSIQRKLRYNPAQTKTQSREQHVSECSRIFCSPRHMEPGNACSSRRRTGKHIRRDRSQYRT